MSLSNSKSSTNRKPSHGDRDDRRCGVIIFVRIFRNRQKKNTIAQSSHNQVDTKHAVSRSKKDLFRVRNGPFEDAKRSILECKTACIRMVLIFFAIRKTFIRLLANDSED